MEKLICDTKEGLFLRENIKVLSAIVVEIAMNSPDVYNLTVSILSQLMQKLDTTAERDKMSKCIYCKFSRLPNIGYLQIWMQRITYKEKELIDYDEKLCKIINNEKVTIWNNDWLKDNLVEDFPIMSMRNSEWLQNSYTPIIDIDEVSIFDGNS